MNTKLEGDRVGECERGEVGGGGWRWIIVGGGKWGGGWKEMLISGGAT
jgi:hypothetical protein